MSLEHWLSEGRLRPHQASAREIADLLQVVDRDLTDAVVPDLSGDRRFATAYNAVLQLATAVLHASGYRAAGAGHHWITLKVLPEIMGPEEQERSDYFDDCRRKRNIADYDAVGVVSESEVREALEEARRFKGVVLAWLRDNHRELL